MEYVLWKRLLCNPVLWRLRVESSLSRNCCEISVVECVLCFCCGISVVETFIAGSVLWKLLLWNLVVASFVVESLLWNACCVFVAE